MAAAAKLGRPAKGLPRYYMDVGWYRHPRFLGLPAATLFVFEACIGYATQHALDGRLPANAEDLAAALGLRASDVRKAIPKLIEREAFERDGDQLVVRGWADHNPTAEQVEAHARRKGEAGRRGNHERWHARRGVSDPNCPWCTGEADDDGSDRPPPDPPPDPQGDRTCDRNSDPPTDRTEDRKPIANPSLGMGWDGIGLLTSSSEERAANRTPDDDDHDQQAPDQGTGPPPAASEPVTKPAEPQATGPDARVGAALATLADRDLDARQEAPGQPPIGDTTAWRNSAYDQRKDRYGDLLATLAAQHPDATPDQLADLADPPPPPTANGHRPRPGADIDPGYQQAARARAERDQAKHRAALAVPVDPHATDRLAQIRAGLRGPGGGS